MKTHSKLKFKQTEIGEIPEDWDTSLLSEVASVNEKSINKNYENSNIEYIDVSSTFNGEVLETQQLALEDAPSRAKRIVLSDDIIISTVRPNLKHFAFITKINPNLIASTGYAVISSSKINPRFLYYYLTTDKYTEFLSAIADTTTSTYPAFNPDVLENSIVPLPSDNEQQKIASNLSSLDDKIELNHRMNKTLEEMGKALFKRWFVDFEFPDENGKPYKSSGGEMVDSELGLIPKRWSVGKLGDLMEITSGKRPSVKKDDKSDNYSVPIIGASGIMGYTSEILYDERIIVTGRVGTLGVVQKIDYPCWTSDNSLVMKSLYFEYAFQALSSIDFTSLNVGSTQPLITQSAIKKLRIIIPEQSLLKGFEQAASRFTSQGLFNNKQSDTLALIRDSLLPRLMSGRLRV